MSSAARSALLSIVFATSAWADGPLAVGWLPLDAWPGGLSSRKAVDAASRTELLTLAGVLADTMVVGEGPTRWLTREKARVTGAYAAASGTATEWDAVVALAHATQADDTHRAFWTTWVAENLRMARRFPEPTSELFPLKASDVMGTELPDLTFALTFDDGPTPLAGNTDRTISMLHELDLEATFFVQGERLAVRQDAKTLYSGFCVASHGMTHVAHIGTPESMNSVNLTRQQLEAAVDHPRIDLFRPPYGQRGNGIATWLERNGVRTVLWNIDSQDWRSDAQAANVAGRVIALMLVQRKGVILFHDVYPVAMQAVRMIHLALGPSTVSWVGCDVWRVLRR